MVPSDDISLAAFAIASISMDDSIVRRRRPREPLDIKDGLNPTRARLPDDATALTAWEWVSTLIEAQRYRHPDDDVDALQARFDAGEVVRANGVPLGPSSIVKPGEDVWFYRIPAPEVPVPFGIDTIYEDDDILVVDKPHFLATMPRARHITESATVRLRRATGLNELTPAHRLDRPTAGVLLLTKRRAVRGAYQELFARRQVSKVYDAVATWSDDLAGVLPVRWENRIEKTPGDLQAYFADGPTNAVTTLAAMRRPTAKERSHLQRVHQTDAELGVYELHPVTGRTHQLRMHMMAAGVPILGDSIYPTVYPAAEEDFDVPLRLVARAIRFVDPLDGVEREFRTYRRFDS